LPIAIGAARYGYVDWMAPWRHVVKGESKISIM
jgi:hypothetical protein